jgi:hypothetical protein
MNLLGYLDGFQDASCDSITKNNARENKGENVNDDEYEAEITGREKEDIETKRTTEKDNKNPGNKNPITDQDGLGSKEDSNVLLPIYIGGGISVMIIFAGIIIGFMIVRYPKYKFLC